MTSSSFTNSLYVSYMSPSSEKRYILDHDFCHVWSAAGRRIAFMCMPPKNNYCLSTRFLDIVIAGRTPYHAPSTFIAPSFKASFLPNLTFAFPHLLYADVHEETN